MDRNNQNHLPGEVKLFLLWVTFKAQTKPNVANNNKTDSIKMNRDCVSNALSENDRNKKLFRREYLKKIYHKVSEIRQALQ